MAVIHRDHLSSEVGHTSGVARVLLGLGLALAVAGVLCFLGAVVWGMVRAGGGSSSASATAPLLTLGGGSVVVGMVVASAGMVLGRRAAGE